MTTENLVQIVQAKENGSSQRIRIISKIAILLLRIMRNHISADKAITQEKLFYKLFKMDYEDNKSSHWMLWEFTKKAMHKLRRDSNCFIVNYRKGIEFSFFVVMDSRDADFYVDKLNECIKSMKYMQQRAYKAAKEKWYQQDWVLDYHKRKTIGRI